MPKPVYIICANGVIEDKTTNLVSIFEAVEAVQLTLMAEPGTVVNRPEGGIPLEASLSVTVAVWMMEDGDADQAYEHEFAVQFDGKEDVVALHPFQFQPPAYLQRFKMRMRGFPPMASPGLLKIVSRVRKTGEGNWIAQQEYPIKVSIIPPSEESPANEAATENAVLLQPPSELN